MLKTNQPIKNVTYVFLNEEGSIIFYYYLCNATTSKHIDNRNNVLEIACEICILCEIFLLVCVLFFYCLFIGSDATRTKHKAHFKYTDWHLLVLRRPLAVNKMFKYKKLLSELQDGFVLSNGDAPQLGRASCRERV